MERVETLKQDKNHVTDEPTFSSQSARCLRELTPDYR